MAAALLYGLRRADAKRRKGNRAKGKISESNLKGKGRRKVMGDIIIQAVGFFGVALFMASYQIRSNRALFLCQMLGCMVFCFQFFLLGAYTGALTLVVNAARNYLLIKSSCWKWARSKAVLIFIIALLAAISLSTWDSWVSMLPFASVTATSIGYWTNNAQKIRISQLIGSPLVLV
ncbi:MAG: YgjV family protein, partial [Mailhella sp.]|nr:YgjV family protein [Mailhella sp.]